MYDIAIVGAGPAGISTALYAVRSGLKTVVVYKDSGALKYIKNLENYYGVGDNVSGNDLFEIGLEQAKKLGVEIVRAEVFGVDKQENFILATSKIELETKTVVLAMGAERKKIKGINVEQFEGRGISYCAVCDGFFFKNKDVAVVGEGDYAMHEANYLKNICKTVTILTNGKEMNSRENENFLMEDKPIKAFYGETKLQGVQFVDETQKAFQGVFMALGSASGFDIAKKIGVQLVNNSIKTDENRMTNVDGIYAVGDCTQGEKQIAKAVYDGMCCAEAVKKHLKKQN